MGSALSLRDLRHRRGKQEVLHIDALDVEPGERLAVLGPNGAGKTTLLRLLAAIEVPSAGRIEIDGTATSALRVDQRRRIAYVTQRAVLLTASVQRNVELPLIWRRISAPTRRAKVAETLELLGVSNLADRMTSTLSGGEAQRVSLARALATEPELLLLDEPAAALDPAARASFLTDAAGALAQHRPTVVHVTHQPDEMLPGVDRVAILVSGGLHQLDTPASVAHHPADATVAGLVGYENLLDVIVQSDGQVCLGGALVGISGAEPAGPAVLAIWASGVRLISRDAGPGLPAEVREVVPGAGRWNVALDAGGPLRAHLPLDRQPPAAGDQVKVVFNPDLVAVVPLDRAVSR